jgi:hypothetical protein
MSKSVITVFYRFSLAFVDPFSAVELPVIVPISAAPHNLEKARVIIQRIWMSPCSSYLSCVAGEWILRELHMKLHHIYYKKREDEL